VIEQRRELIAKAERVAGMDEPELRQQHVRTLLVDLAQALREATPSDGRLYANHSAKLAKGDAWSLDDEVAKLAKGGQLTEEELRTMSRGHCPLCNHRGFVLGPRGGAAQNITCGGCGAPFNVTTFGHEVVMGERLPLSR